MQKGFVAATLKLWVTFPLHPEGMEKSKNNNNQLGLCIMVTLVLLQVDFCLLFFPNVAPIVVVFFGLSCWGNKQSFLFCFQFYPGTAALNFFLDVVDFSLSWLHWLNRFIFSIKYLLFII